MVYLEINDKRAEISSRALIGGGALRANLRFFIEIKDFNEKFNFAL